MGRHPGPLHLQPNGHLQRRRSKGFAETTKVHLESNFQSQLLEAMKCAYLIVLMATYWMTEAMPLPITSMIPMVTRFQIEIVLGEKMENYEHCTRSVFHFWA